LKKFLTYEELRSNILTFIPRIKEEYDPTHVVGIVRGGLTISHIIAKELTLPVGVWYPSKDVLTIPDYIPGQDARLLICEDLIAQGRTLTLYQNSASLHAFTTKFFAYLVDAKYDGDQPEYHVANTSEWLVFPWESIDHVVEGDRGLFRDGTDQYAKDI
jgi:hypoxanthine phosphoribosyltransferase